MYKDQRMGVQNGGSVNLEQHDTVAQDKQEEASRLVEMNAVRTKMIEAYFYQVLEIQGNYSKARLCVSRFTIYDQVDKVHNNQKAYRCRPSCCLSASLLKHNKLPSSLVLWVK